MGGYEVHRPEAGIAILALQGEHDLASRDALLDLARRLVEEPSLLIVDLRDASFIDSSVLNMLALADRLLRQRDARLTLLLERRDPAWRVLEASGLHNQLPCAPDQSDAITLARHHADKTDSRAARAGKDRPDEG